MSSHMIFQVTLGGKSFLAIINMAFERLFSSVAPDMSLQVALLAEPLLAALVGADIGFRIILKEIY